MLMHARARSIRLIVVVTLVWLRTIAVSPGSAQQHPVTAESLVLDDVTVVDVEQGKLLAGQRVVIIGNRIQAVANGRVLKAPRGARVVNARGQYLIPGLWDMHAHVAANTNVYALLVASGVTGIREMASSWPAGFDTIAEQRRDIARGALIGPRIVATSQDFYSPICRPQAMKDFGRTVYNSIFGVTDKPDSGMLAGIVAGFKLDNAGCFRMNANVVATPEGIRRAVEALKAGGVDFVKSHGIGDRQIYLAFLAEARRLGIPAVGHLKGADGRALTESEASDSGLRSVEHINEMACWQDEQNESRVVALPDSIAERQCTAVAERFRRNGTWLVPTLYVFNYPIFGPIDRAGVFNRAVAVAHRAGVPMLAGTDAFTQPASKEQALESALHKELALLVAAGFTPLEALQAATLNPAKFFGATDSLGTIAAGRLADGVLLGANPLANITNTTTIRAVIVNGRFLDRAALDQIITEAKQTMVKPQAP